MSRLAWVALLATVCALAPSALSAASPDGTRAIIRLDQTALAPAETKLAYLMSPSAITGESFKVVSASGGTVAAGQVGKISRGSWNHTYRFVYPIDLSSVSTPGSYRLIVGGPATAAPQPLRVEPAAQLARRLVLAGLSFFRNQRDGNGVPAGALRRRPSHLNDAAAGVYAHPRFGAGGSDVILGNLRRIGGPVNVEGGWFDAGDYLKFTFTAAYADDLLYVAARALGRHAPRALTAEAAYGVRWLRKMWLPARKVLLLQVGIGSGNETTFYGDHDLWRLPQGDDRDGARMDRFAARHRPVFEAGPPGSRIAPDIAGRVAAAFALAAQADVHRHHARAERELRDATSLYRLADTHPLRHLASVLPTSYYPESIWHDAMELAATEIVLAEQTLRISRRTFMPYLRQATRWASDYIARDSGGDTLNLYDVSALAHADLLTAIERAGSPSGLAVSRPRLIADLRNQLASAARRAVTDIFHAGGQYDQFDVDSHTFGFISTEALYEKATGSTAYSQFAAEQRQWLFGANPWGMSFMVGLGPRFPDCMQSQIPNLAGSLNGHAPVDTGAVVNGPNSAAIFRGGLGGLQSGMRRCENDTGKVFTGHGSEYVDDVRAWQTNEPALDMTGSAILAGALSAG